MSELKCIKGVFYFLRASGTVYTAIDIATGQEVRQTLKLTVTVKLNARVKLILRLLFIFSVTDSFFSPLRWLLSK